MIESRLKLVDLIIRVSDGLSPAAQPVEVVERKGLGHPDSICDALAERFCIRLCRYYLDQFGVILHHNVDKVLLCGGAARPAFGGGEILEPIEIYMAGRATRQYDGVSIPVEEIAVEAARSWLREHVPEVDLDRDVRIVPRLRSGSADLVRLFASDGSDPPSNDTSCGVGFAPLTDLESIVLGVERRLTGEDTRHEHPAIGPDVKVMAVRRDSRIDLTISCGFIGRFLHGLTDYLEAKDIVRSIGLAVARERTAAAVNITVNAADAVARGLVFLTVTGTSAEAGDDGEVGRGNRVCGLITPYRPMTLEAAAGKNPVSHVGKLYSLAAARIAAAIVRDNALIHHSAITLVSQIGRRVRDPQVADVRLALEGMTQIAAVEPVVRETIQEQLGTLGDLRRALLEDRVPVF